MLQLLPLRSCTACRNQTFIFQTTPPKLLVTHLVVVTGSQTDIDILALTGLHEEP